jgi:nitroreductase
VGWDLYGLLGISKGDKARMHAQHGRNYKFFDAPVGLLFTIDASMSEGSFIDCGMFLQNVMLAARSRGLDTCPQVAFTKFHTIIAAELSIPANQLLLCGMSLGYGDFSQPENSLVTEREHVARFAVFHP